MLLDVRCDHTLCGSVLASDRPDINNKDIGHGSTLIMALCQLLWRTKHWPFSHLGLGFKSSDCSTEV